MSAVQRFFRRYIVSTVGIVILFLAVNLALFVAIILTGSMSGADTSFSVRDFSDHVVMQDEKWVADDAALSMLQEQSAWAMLLNEDGDVVWQQNLPEKLPRSRSLNMVVLPQFGLPARAILIAIPGSSFKC